MNDNNVTILCQHKLIISSDFLISTCPKDERINHGGRSHSGNRSSQPLTTSPSIKVEEKFYISQNITSKHETIIYFECRRLSERKAWISSHFRYVLVATMTWQLIWNVLWRNYRSKAELVEIYKFAKLRLAKPKFSIKYSTLSELKQYLCSSFFFELWFLPKQN